MHSSHFTTRKQTDVDLTLCTIHLYIESSVEVHTSNCKQHNITHPHFWQWWGLSPFQTPLTSMIICSTHTSLFHDVTNSTLTTIRQTFCIPKARQRIKPLCMYLYHLQKAQWKALLCFLHNGVLWVLPPQQMNPCSSINRQSCLTSGSHLENDGWESMLVNSLWYACCWQSLTHFILASINSAAVGGPVSVLSFYSWYLK